MPDNRRLWEEEQFMEAFLHICEGNSGISFTLSKCHRRLLRNYTWIHKTAWWIYLGKKKAGIKKIMPAVQVKKTKEHGMDLCSRQFIIAAAQNTDKNQLFWFTFSGGSFSWGSKHGDIKEYIRRKLPGWSQIQSPWRFTEELLYSICIRNRSESVHDDGLSFIFRLIKIIWKKLPCYITAGKLFS